MENTNDYYRKPENKLGGTVKKGLMKKPLTFFLIIVAIIFLMSVFFKIGKIEVKGNSLYSDEEIITASGLQTGDSLFFTNRISAGSRVVIKLPYVDAVSIKRYLPNKLVILVEESNAVGYINIDGELWTISQSGKYLGTVDTEEAAMIAEISGISASNPSEGDILVPAAGDEEKFEYLLAIMEQISGRGMAGDVTAIDMTMVSNAVVEYQHRLTAKLGANEDVEYKFGKLVSAISQIDESGGGELDLTEGNKVYYTPN